MFFLLINFIDVSEIFEQGNKDSSGLVSFGEIEIKFCFVPNVSVYFQTTLEPFEKVLFNS